MGKIRVYHRVSGPLCQAARSIRFTRKQVSLDKSV
jgi:hypothetical protein